VLGSVLRAVSEKAEKLQFQQRAQELTGELATVKSDLAKVQSESATRAGFESLAAERLETLLERNRQLEGAKRQLEEKDREILRLTSVNSKLETDLANERGNGERLTDQFKVLANEILKDNSRYSPSRTRKAYRICSTHSRTN